MKCYFNATFTFNGLITIDVEMDFVASVAHLIVAWLSFTLLLDGV